MNRLFLSALIIIFFTSSSYAENISEHLNKKIFSMDPVIVRSQRMIEYVKNHPNSVVTLDRDEILQRNFLEVGEAIDSMSGIDVKESGSGTGHRISIRGSGGSGKVLVLINGRPVNSSQYGSVNLDSIPMEIVSKIMVFKPPVPVWIGSGATAGAVNIITGTHIKKGSKKKETKKRLKISGGSYGKAKLSSSIVLSGGDDKSIMVTAEGSHRDGKRKNSDRDTGSFSFHLDKKTSSHSQYDFNARYYHSFHGSPGPIDNPTPDARQRYEKKSFDLMCKGLAGSKGDFSIKSYGDITNLEDSSQTGYKSKLKAYKIGIKGDTNWVKENGKWAFRVGGLLEKDNVDHNISGDHHREKYSLHTQFDRAFDNSTFSIGLRGDYTNDFYFSPAYTTGFSYAFGENFILKSNFGYSEKIPSFSQLYQSSHGSIDQVRGNKDLDEEKIYSYDMVLEKKFNKWINIETGLFRTDTYDLVMYERNKADLIYRPLNIDRAYKEGLEFSMKINMKDKAYFDLNYILQTSKNRETGGKLAYIPQSKLKATLKFSLKTITRVEMIFRALSHQYSEAENKKSEIIDSYTSTDIKIIRPFDIKSVTADFFVHFQNIFDKNFEFHHGYPDDGFRFICGLNFNF